VKRMLASSTANRRAAHRYRWTAFMSRFASFWIVFATFAGASLAFASQEGVLPFGSFRFESPGIADSAAVIVAGRQGAKGMESLSIEAFGKRIDLSTKQLEALPGGLLNGLQISYEAGYKETGGRTLHLMLSQGFTSGVVARRFVRVTESGSVKVGEAP
jgi:hypothetical protein